MVQNISSQTGRWILVALSLLFALVEANLALTVRTLRCGGEHAAPAPSRSTLPCTAIPTKLVLQDPECADKLLRAMNVTNVRILPRSAVTSGPPRQTGPSALNSP